MKPLFLVIVVSFFSLGCSTIARLGHGANRPKIESASSINKWLTKKGFEQGIQASSSPDEYEFFSPRFLQSIFVFDKTGRFHAVGYHQGKKCVNDIDKLIGQLQPAEKLFATPDSFIVYQYLEEGYIDNVHEKSKKELEKLVQEHKKKAKVFTDTLFLNYSFIENKIRTATGEKFDINIDSIADYTLILPYAKFEGNWVQVSDLRKYYRAALNNPHAKFNIIFLNLDKQEWWGQEWNAKIRINN